MARASSPSADPTSRYLRAHRERGCRQLVPPRIVLMEFEATYMVLLKAEAIAQGAGKEVGHLVVPSDALTQGCSGPCRPSEPHCVHARGIMIGKRCSGEEEPNGEAEARRMRMQMPKEEPGKAGGGAARRPCRC